MSEHIDESEEEIKLDAKKTFLDSVVLGLINAFAILIVVPMIVWLLRLSLGAIWWLVKGNTGDVSVCSITTDLDAPMCQMTTGAVGIDRIGTWFLTTDFFYVLPSISVLSLGLGISLWFTMTNSDSPKE
jgi:hypothetical protein